jgi:hypothetical protein
MGMRPLDKERAQHVVDMVLVEAKHSFIALRKDISDHLLPTLSLVMDCYAALAMTVSDQVPPKHLTGPPDVLAQRNPPFTNDEADYAFV